MSALLITYDLNRPSQDYEAVHKAIKGLGGAWLHPLESTWIVTTTHTRSSAYDVLKPTFDSSDYFFVVDITTSARQGWLKKTSWTWINENV
ncbi:MAG: hypothetical protein KF761_11165 [Salinibacterium sp.]|nr:hypothetical protein [Salinibacterium sp.]